LREFDKVPKSPPAIGQGSSPVTMIWRLGTGIKWAIAGLFCLGLGIWLFFDPNLRGDPARVSLRDSWVAFLTFFVGLALIALAIYQFVKVGADTPKKKGDRI
jgi:hypothetical protein